MKKLVYLLAAGSMAFVACQNSPSYKVTGSVEDITDGDTIYLQEYAGGNLVKLDSAIVKSGTFVFTGKQDTAVNRYITYMKGDKRYFTDLFLENGNINVKQVLKLVDGYCDKPSMTIEVTDFNEAIESVEFILEYNNSRY